MRTTNNYYLNGLWNFITKVSKAIVSGISSQDNYMKPNNKTHVDVEDEEIQPDFEKHYHRPHAKPVVEKQTLHKEIKKAKGNHK